MTSYFMSRVEEGASICVSCKWMDTVEADDEPCCYCDEYGGKVEPIDFDYEKLRSERL